MDPVIYSDNTTARIFSTVLLKGDGSPHSLDSDWITGLYKESLTGSFGGSSSVQSSKSSLNETNGTGSNLEIGPRRVAFIKHFLNHID